MTTVVNVVLNVGVVVISTLAQLIRKLKLKFLEIKQQKRIKARFERKLLKIMCDGFREKIRLKKEQVERRAARALEAEKQERKRLARL